MPDAVMKLWEKLWRVFFSREKTKYICYSIVGERIVARRKFKKKRKTCG